MVLLQLLSVFAGVIQTIINMMILIIFHALFCIVSVSGLHVLVGQTSFDPSPPYIPEAVTVTVSMQLVVEARLTEDVDIWSLGAMPIEPKRKKHV